MATTIALQVSHIARLDLSPLEAVVEPLLTGGSIAKCEQQLVFVIDIPRDPNDPRELSEIPEVRLWFVRADARYPWLPFALDWRAGELGRYAAMLVPHEFHRTEGIQYNPEALELFVMSKIFAIANWLGQQQLPSRSRLQSFAQMLGYDLDDAFFKMLAPADS
ncbi:hypothetical protein KR51_00009390 [Rubidibacter lacunae KORDI 51-2]|uniref:DUF1817 domain-containing protein n=1 Tax=Rubidibacter lacunae KORDI 51-2 TaxID=582515 RepID=U5DP76_9CHRO|nr:CRR6 family NdhI maturation factor [Rubidibacter lacunae]ERN42414.1 hypothetical protein KR51_00009390 [Rubidibacter lacunae KORDI 51-2]